MQFSEKLKKAVTSSRSTLCVGLDPNLDRLPSAIKQQHAAPEEQVVSFCRQVIEATSDFCCAYKPNAAFFEALGPAAYEVFAEVRKAIPEGKIVIADAKRGDISTTAAHYSKAFFEQFDADAITLNPLMGFETLDPFMGDASRAIFSLALTSNPGAADFLLKPFAGYEMMSEYIAAELKKRNRPGDTHLGMVVGATQADHLERVVKRHPSATLLIPGIGKQGGSVEELARALKGHEGIPIVSSSRSIIYAGADRDNWQQAVAEQAQHTQKQLQTITQRYVQ